MKKLIFLFGLALLFAAIMPPTDAQAQTRYGRSTFPLDTLTSETVNFYLPGTYGDDEVKQMVTWQLRATRIADTVMMRIYIEETIDDDTNPDYVIVQTLDNYEKLVVSTNPEAKYLVHVPLRGRRQRLRIVGTVNTGSAQIEVDAWRRDKVPLTVTDEF